MTQDAVNAVRSTSLPLRTIHRNANQPRQYFEPEALQELAGSMQELGLLQPIIVRPIECTCEQLCMPGHFLIVAGERRWRAALQLGWSEIDSRILQDVSERDAYIMSVSENIARKDMLPSEIAGALQHLLNLGIERERVGQMFGHTANWVDIMTQLLGMAPEVLEAHDRGELNAGSTWFIRWLTWDHQREVLRKLNNGEFASQRAIQQFAYALQRVEQDPGIQEAEIPPEHLVKQDRFETSWKRIQRIEHEFNALFGLLPTEVNSVLARDPQQYLAELDSLEHTVRRAKALFEQAIVNAEVNQTLQDLDFPVIRRASRVHFEFGD